MLLTLQNDALTGTERINNSNNNISRFGNNKVKITIYNNDNNNN